MRNAYLLTFALLGLLHSAQAQCSYSSQKDGNWNDPSTWKATGTGCASVPGAGATVTVGHNVALTGDYTVNGEGSLVITANGALVQDQPGRTLTLGDGTGSQTVRLTQAGRVAVSALAINKSNLTISSGAVLTLYCNLTQSNQSNITLDGDINLLGTLNITTGNVSANGTGRMRVAGCVTSSNGGFNNYSSSLTICVQEIVANNCGAGSGTCTPNAPINNDAACRSVLPVLPVTLLYARASWQAKQAAVQLQWATATEEQNAGFAVERSADGREFEAVATVPGAGTSLVPRSYAYLDAKPLPSRLSYYRLRQTDFDGAVHYSPLMVVKNGRTTLDLELQPAAEGTFRALLPGLVGSGQLAVYSAAGRLISTYSINDHEELPLVDLRRQPAGVYLVRVLTAGGTITQRVVRL
ncbi:T9SS type A sorting domain-containing protein [Hymenobacter sp. 15J16-1T3B]|uniref:T9SS type A sorting domain-containing protein n=1 Tax=Hymenobacter sp. 15J16-1T3B TaxID=2886941 RepID=UPI001D0F50E0|nr:T9SS type A sorting domain-containing protein [Hymenobacter sp. 15J16-1T3B]MCC3157186.1 T9SS type A sorting domain-containing protein [Hymenobacter sp. 15J16-1T3B]